MPHSVWMLQDNFDPFTEAEISLHATFDGAVQKALSLVRECYKGKEELLDERDTLMDIGTWKPDDEDRRDVEYADNQFVSLVQVELAGGLPPVHIEDLVTAFQQYQSESIRATRSSSPAAFRVGMEKAMDAFKQFCEAHGLADRIDWSER